MAELTLAQRAKLRADVVAYLAETAPLPSSTLHLGDRFRLDGWQRGYYLWRILDRLARQGHIERIKIDGHSARYWRWAAPSCPDTPEGL